MRNRLGIPRLMRSYVNCIVSDKEMEIVSKCVKDVLILPADVNLTVVVQYINSITGAIAESLGRSKTKTQVRRSIEIHP